MTTTAATTTEVGYLAQQLAALSLDETKTPATTATAAAEPQKTILTRVARSSSTRASAVSGIAKRSRNATQKRVNATAAKAAAAAAVATTTTPAQAQKEPASSTASSSASSSSSTTTTTGKEEKPSFKLYTAKITKARNTAPLLRVVKNWQEKAAEKAALAERTTALTEEQKAVASNSPSVISILAKKFPSGSVKKKTPFILYDSTQKIQGIALVRNVTNMQAVMEILATSPDNLAPVAQGITPVHGVGDMILAHIVKDMVATGKYDHLEIESVNTELTLKYYASRGFKKTGEEGTGHYPDTIPMSASLTDLATALKGYAKTHAIQVDGEPDNMQTLVATTLPPKTKKTAATTSTSS